jgi:ABC-2 type transport system permease protein
MRNILAITRKELHHYFASPIAYVLATMFLFINGFIFLLLLYFQQQADMQPVIMNMGVIFLFLCPLITMRLFSEERRTGTIEILMTSPVSDTEAVLGKFFGAVGMLAVMLALTLHLPLFLILFGKPDIGPLWCSYLGLLLLGAGYLALGLLASSLAKNQIVAAVSGFGLILFLWLLSASGDIFSPPVTDILKYLSFFDHFEEFTRGILDTRDLIFYLSFIGYVLYLTVLAIRNRKWR